MYVVHGASQAGTQHAPLKHKALQVDSELVYAYAKTNNLAALEEFISGAHQANLGQVCCPTCLRHVCACRCIHCSMLRQLVCHLSSLVPHPRPGEQRTGLCALATGRPSIREQRVALRSPAQGLRIAPSAG